MFSRLFSRTSLLIASLLIAALAIVIVVFTPAGPEEEEDAGVTTLYFADNLSAAQQTIIDRFNERYRGRVQVVPINLPFTKFSTNERKQLLTRALRSKSSRIDIFAVDVVWTPRFVKWAEPLSRYFSAKEQQAFLPQALASCFSGGELVSVPFYFDIGILYYRRDLLQALPDFAEVERKLKASMTWEDFIELGRRFAARQPSFYLFPADSYEGLMCSLVENIGHQHPVLISGDSLGINTPAAQRALQLLVDLVGRYRLTPPAVTGYKEVDVYEHALAEDALFFRGWPGNLRTYESRYGDKVKAIAFAALPHFAGSPPAAVFGGWNLMIARDSNQKAAALEFLKFATSREMQRLVYETMGYLPAIHSVYDDSLFCARHPDLRYYRQLLATGMHRPALVEYTKISDILSFFAHRAIKQEISVPAALAGAAAMIRSQKVLIN
ncbi:MAG: extracellular solute-binding protein [candidate division KSB1 bacterium]|nr:extracellular solute-binding protein [candidate division KSB1 bacterium]MDZ7276275.1 extracellular solute-binding protein [candidate division KSB1 bacterium]MDZ7287919.1 extracellular solute-binding protein [candidate division KSB1 bacterium]MDZ7300068.1 extracellular solute-binding protein [candidate division KSB1 bacterium]MDZ7307310.1 extracellular solute-binding protein [candidate division KSB1 bacterium]